MNTADEILLILLAVVLVIFIILLIWATVYLLKILKSAKRVMTDAEKIVDSAETVSEVFKNASGPVALVRLVRTLTKVVNKQKKGS